MAMMAMTTSNSIKVNPPRRPGPEEVIGFDFMGITRFFSLG
jgi:hypothetical protein